MGEGRACCEGHCCVSPQTRIEIHLILMSIALGKANTIAQVGTSNFLIALPLYSSLIP
jgi:hypothetical protein